MFDVGETLVVPSNHLKFDGEPVPGISGKVLAITSGAFYTYYKLNTPQGHRWIAAENGRH